MSTAKKIVELDVRIIPPRDKHPKIFETFDSLKSGEVLLIINDHDPRPLKYQFEFERLGKYGWKYLEEGPEVWKVEIERL
ncbi:MAG TPA: hemerythrin [Nitrospiraceae bacterium]|nr:hemerythrin [Nitrospiraceae bacterium]